MQLKNIMTENVATVSPEDSLQKAAQIMKEKNVGAVPVCKGDKPVGIVTDRDISIRATAEGKNETTSVKDVMSSDIIKASPEMSVKEAAELMAQKQIRRLPVSQNNSLQGIVSLGDLAVESKTDTEAAEALTSISIPSKPQN
ncbi:MAG: CBS domain-containing protein [Bacillota bacterium]